MGHIDLCVLFAEAQTFYHLLFLSLFGTFQKTNTIWTFWCFCDLLIPLWLIFVVRFVSIDHGKCLKFLHAHFLGMGTIGHLDILGDKFVHIIALCCVNPFGKHAGKIFKLVSFLMWLTVEVDRGFVITCPQYLTASFTFTGGIHKSYYLNKLGLKYKPSLCHSRVIRCYHHKSSIT